MKCESRFRSMAANLGGWLMMHDRSCRGGMSVLPTTAALVGGLVAQEGIKLITNQYGPLNGTCVVDLVKGGMTRYKV
jgi:hypothetical protein